MTTCRKLAALSGSKEGTLAQVTSGNEGLESDSWGREARPNARHYFLSSDLGTSSAV